MHSDTPIFNPAQLESMASVSPDVVRQVVDLFFTTGRERLDAIRAAAGDDRWDDVNGLAHSLKGSSASVGAERLAAMASELETATDGTPEDLQRLRAGLDEFDVECSRVREAISAFMERLGG